MEGIELSLLEARGSKTRDFEMKDALEGVGMTDMKDQYLKNTRAVETANAKEMISELADELKQIGHSGGSIFEWFMAEAIRRGKKDFLFCDVAAELQKLADEHSN